MNKWIVNIIFAFSYYMNHHLVSSTIIQTPKVDGKNVIYKT